MAKQHSILLVDDDREFQKAMKRLFEKSGYDVTLACDGQEALPIIESAEFDLIISDMRMPNMNGIELMQEIRRKKIETPIIFLTAFGEVESYMDLMNMGAFEYVNKPVKSEEILRVAGKAIEKYRRNMGRTSLA